MTPVFGLVLVLAAAGTATTPADMANRPVDTLNLQRYAGRWHEIAHLPTFFQRQCAGDITATYRLKPNDRIEVRNVCRTHRGETTEVVGEAKPVPGKPGALKVRFAPRWLGWLPLAWADYWVIALDPRYQWAVVGSPNRKYLWVLSRQPAMDGTLFEQIKADARQRGYAVEKLVVAAPIRRSPVE